jgi:hypothetical protein
MKALPLLVLRRPMTFWEEVRAQRVGWPELLRLALFIMFACAVYGAVLAGWRSVRLAAYVAIKLPVLFLATTALVSLFNWMLALLLGAALRFRQTLAGVLGAMTVAAWILLSLTPVSLLFVLSGVPYSGNHDEVRYAHNSILVTHILAIACAGVAGNVALFKGLRQVVPPRCPGFALFAAWVGMYAFVGCQMSWILRPFVGSPFYPVVFMRPDCLQRNFYEFVFTEILPYLLTGGA